MKIIDFERKGNVVRFYLGKESLEDWYGDDWSDKPYEHNAGIVYDKFVSGVEDILFDFNDIVVEPSDSDDYYSKDEMKDRNVPCIVVLKNADIGENEYISGFSDAICRDYAKRIYFGDDISKARKFGTSLKVKNEGKNKEV